MVRWVRGSRISHTMGTRFFLRTSQKLVLSLDGVLTTLGECAELVRPVKVMRPVKLLLFLCFLTELSCKTRTGPGVGLGGFTVLSSDRSSSRFTWRSIWKHNNSNSRTATYCASAIERTHHLQVEKSKELGPPKTQQTRNNKKLGTMHQGLLSTSTVEQTVPPGGFKENWSKVDVFIPQELSTLTRKISCICHSDRDIDFVQDRDIRYIIAASFKDATRKSKPSHSTIRVGSTSVVREQATTTQSSGQLILCRQRRAVRCTWMARMSTSVARQAESDCMISVSRDSSDRISTDVYSSTGASSKCRRMHGFPVAPTPTQSRLTGNRKQTSVGGETTAKPHQHERQTLR